VVVDLAEVNAFLAEATRTRAESSSLVGDAEIRQDRRKMIPFNAIGAEAQASSPHPRSSFSAQIAANRSHVMWKSMKSRGWGRASRDAFHRRATRR